MGGFQLGTDLGSPGFPFGHGGHPESWVVLWDSHPPRLYSLPALAAGAAVVVAAATDSASFISASWLQQWLQQDLEGSEEGARWVAVSSYTLVPK